MSSELLQRFYELESFHEYVCDSKKAQFLDTLGKLKFVLNIGGRTNLEPKDPLSPIINLRKSNNLHSSGVEQRKSFEHYITHKHYANEGEFAEMLANNDTSTQLMELSSMYKRIQKTSGFMTSIVQLISVDDIVQAMKKISQEIMSLHEVEKCSVHIINRKMNSQVVSSSPDSWIDIQGYLAKFENFSRVYANESTSLEDLNEIVEPNCKEKIRNAMCYSFEDVESQHSMLISLGNKIHGKFGEEDELILNAFCAPLYQILKNAERYREKQKQTNRNEALLEISRLLTSQLEMDTIVNVILSKAKMLVSADRCTFYHVNYEKEELIAIRCDGITDLKIPIYSGIAGEVVRTKSPQIVDNVRKNPNFYSSVDNATGYQTNCILAIPILNESRDTVIAVVQMINKTDGNTSFSNDEMEVLLSFVTFAMISLNNSKIYEKAKKNEEKAVLLLNTFKTLSSSLDMDSVLATITIQARELLDADRASVFIVDHEKQEIWSTFAEEHKLIIRMPITTGIAGYVARTGELLNIPDVYNDPRFNQEVDRKSGYRTRSILCMPIISNSGRIIAVTQMINKRSGGSFNSEDEELLRAFANDAGISLQNSQLYEKARGGEGFLDEGEDLRRSNPGDNNRIKYLMQELESGSIAQISDVLLDVSNASFYEIYLLDNDRTTLKKIGTKSVSLERKVSLKNKYLGLLEECLKTSNILYGKEDQFNVMCVPLVSSRQTIGAIKIFSSSNFNRKINPSIIESCYKLARIIIRQYCTKPFEKEDEEILALFSLQASIAIENSQQFQKSTKMQNYLQAVLSSIDSYVFSVDINGKLVRCNHELSCLLGIPTEVIQEKPFMEWRNYCHSANQLFYDDFQDSFENMRPITNLSFEYFQSDSKSMIFRYSIVPLKDEDEKTGSVVVLEDLSLTRKLLQSLEALEAGSLSLVSHPFSYTNNTITILSEIRKISSSKRVLLFIGDNEGEYKLTYYVDYSSQLYFPTNPDYNLADIQYHASLIDHVVETKDSLFKDTTTYCGPLLFGEKLLGILYVDGLGEISDETQRIFQVLGSLIVTYMEIGNKLGLEVEKRLLMNKTQELQKSNTQLKELRDKAQQSERAKAAFLMNMSHEIRTPLNAVIGFTEMLLDTPLDKKQKKFAKIIKSSGESLLAIIGNILDLSKIEADEMNVENIQFDLRATLEDAMEMIAQSADKNNLTLSLDIPPSLPSTLNGDPYRLRQIVTNLLANACKFTHGGYVVLRVSEAQQGSNGGSNGGSRGRLDARKVIRKFLFEIIDSGIGISVEDQAKLFKPFSQADSSTTKKYEGTGLGLVICKKLAELMKGEIGIQSEVNRGTTIFFTAEFEVMSIQKSSSNLLKERQMFALKRANVLVVTSCEMVFQSIKTVLGYYGLNLSLFSCVSECKRYIASLPTSTLIFRVIIDSSMVDEFYQDYEAVPQLENCKFISLVRFKLRAMKLNSSQNISKCDFEIPTYFKLKTLLGCFEPTPQKSTEVKLLSSSYPSLNNSNNNQRPKKRRKKILLAEDNELNQKLILRQLKKVGYDADAAHNGLQAVEKVKNRSYDLILMDCHMPEMDGYEATQIIREREQEKRVPIVALTADAMQGTRDRCLAAGMDDYYTKPLRLQDIIDITTKFLS